MSGQCRRVLGRGKLSAMRRPLGFLVVLAATSMAPGIHADPAHAPSTAASAPVGHVPGAAALEGRIIAPCCWNQTIDIHGSEVSNALRREIRTRLAAGEPAEAIERSLVERYGERVIAVPRGSRLGSTGVLLAMSMGIAGVGALLLLRRWRDRSHGASAAPTPDAADTAANPALDARLDAELAALDRE